MQYAIKLTRPGIKEPAHLHRDMKHFTWETDRETHALFDDLYDARFYAGEAHRLADFEEGDIHKVIERPMSVMDKVIFAQVG